MAENKPSGVAYKDPNFDSVSIGGVEITASEASGDVTGLAGFAYIFYTVI